MRSRHSDLLAQIHEKGPYRPPRRLDDLKERFQPSEKVEAATGGDD